LKSRKAENMESLDWVVIALYFAVLLGVAWWVIRKSKDTADDYFLAGRNLGWWIVGASIFASNIGSEHLVGLAGSGCTDGVAMAHYELHAWCLLVLGWVLVPFYMRSKVFTMPEFLERRFNPTSRWVLSVISLVAYVVTKIAVGIFAGGIVFSVLLPDLRLGPLDAFWIGSILVIVLTGIYTVLGGLRAVAYTEALQTVVLVVGSLMVTYFGLQAIGGWAELRAICGSEMFNLWKPLVPEGMTATWAPVKEADRMAWYFNDNYPWLSMLFCAPVIGLWYWCTDQYIVQRVLGAPDETQARRGTIFAAMLKLLPVFIFIIPGMICFALASSGRVEALQQQMIGPDGQVIRDQAQKGVSSVGGHRAADGHPRLGRGRSVGGLDEFAGRSVQRVGHPVHHGFLLEAAPDGVPEAAGLDRPSRHDDHGVDRLGLDPGDPGRQGIVRLPAGRASLSGAADLRRLFPGHFLEAAERRGMLGRLDRRLGDGPVPLGDRHAAQVDYGVRLRAEFVPVDCQQHVLPVLQHPDPAGFGHRDDRGQLRDRGAGLPEDQRADLRHADGRTPPRVARQLGRHRRHRLSRRHGRHPGRLPVLPRLNERIAFGSFRFGKEITVGSSVER
jgi:SSS family transporter